MTVLAVKNLSLTINDKPILKNISFDIKAGEIFGLVGESGSGKSLSASTITQLLPEHCRLSGSIIFESKNILKNNETEMNKIRGRKISIIFQEPMTALNPLKTIGDQVAETFKIHLGLNYREALRQAEIELIKVGLDPTVISRRNYPHELSGGQRQRVMIAIAIALKPTLLIADEPTTALDVTTQSKILVLLRDLVRTEKIALCLITHDLAVIAEMADRLAIMRNGEIVDKGTPSSIFLSLSNEHTRKILSDAISPPQKLSKIHDCKLLRANSISKTFNNPFNFLKKYKNNKPTLNNITFSLLTGECIGLIGESGCGKSTLARSILGLERLDRGSITLDGSKISYNFKTDKEVRAKIQVVFQDPYGSFNPKHRVSRIISEPFNLLRNKPTGNTKQILLRNALTDVGLSERDLTKYPHQFSGGQRQRLALARALIIRPKVIILDEALSALDVSLRNSMIFLLQNLSKKYQLSYIFISHDINLVRSITNRILIMKNGEIIEYGKTEKVLQDPQKSYTKSLISATPLLPEQWIKNAKNKGII